MTRESEAPRSGDPSPGTKASARTEPGRALIRLPAPASKSSFVLQPQHAVWAAGVVLVLATATVGVQAVRTSAVESALAAKRVQADATAQLLQKLQAEVSRLKGSVDTLRVAADPAKQDDSLRGIKKSVDSLKQEVEQVRSTSGTTLAQLSTKIDKTDHDPSAKLAEIVARLDKLDHDPKSDATSQKMADIASRLERVERQVSAPLVTGSIPATTHATAPAVSQAVQPVPKPTAALAAGAPLPLARPAGKPDTTVVAEADPKALAAKPPTVDGWVVRDVYDGLALVEARRGGLREIAPGEFLPGAGEVRSIERRGKAWVVLTSRGVIENSTW